MKRRVPVSPKVVAFNILKIYKRHGYLPLGSRTRLSVKLGVSNSVVSNAVRKLEKHGVMRVPGPRSELGAKYHAAGRAIVNFLKEKGEIRRGDLKAIAIDNKLTHELILEAYNNMVAHRIILNGKLVDF